jgi:pilus assembly protein CpaE
MSLQKIRRALRESNGLAAVEFAIIAPVLAFMIIALADVANFAVAVTSMQRAERVGMQYFMNGGTDTTVAKALVTGAWSNPPGGYTVTTAKVCSCPGNGLATACGSSCSDGQRAWTNMRVTASATVPGALMSLPESRTETVRVQ